MMKLKTNAKKSLITGVEREKVDIKQCNCDSEHICGICHKNKLIECTKSTYKSRKGVIQKCIKIGDKYYISRNNI